MARTIGLRVVALLVLMGFASAARAQDVRIKDLGHFLGWRDNALVGYGIVMGLAGSGDSPHSAITQHALTNVLSRLGSNIAFDQLQSRNVAAVVVTATLPPTANVGDKIDVAVSSIADARSLVGGTLLMTPLMGPDERSYALAQGQLVVGGYRFDSSLNREQKNYPTSGVLPSGATVETPATVTLLGSKGLLTFILNDPDVTTAVRVSDAIDRAFGRGSAKVQSASAITINPSQRDLDLYQLIAEVETLTISPDMLARVVVNERTGTVVSGGGVRISSVTVSQGDVRVSVHADNDNPGTFSGAFGPSSQHMMVTNTKLEVSSPREDAVAAFPNTTVTDLVQGLNRVHIDTRGIIAILQAVRAAGALHADIIVQ